MSDWKWWEQYEDRARSLSLFGDAYPVGAPEKALLYGAADDIRTLVDGLKQHERERAAVFPADTTEGTG